MNKVNVFFVLLLCLSLSFQCAGYGGVIAYHERKNAEDLMTALLVPAFIILFPKLSAGALGLAGVGVGGLLLIGVLDKVFSLAKGYIAANIDNTKQLQANFSKEYNENIAMFDNKSSFLTTKFPEKIKNRIDAIINQKYINEKNESFEIFPTPQSKIFVLQNIEDFFEFSQNKEFKIFNSIVYEACSKKINKLQKQKKQLALVHEASPIENYKKMIEIDKWRDYYMKEFEISASTLKNMSSTKLNNKILDVQTAVKQLATDLSKQQQKIGLDGKGQKLTQEKIKEQTQEAIEGVDPKIRALWSIFVHLSYKQESKKQPMFIDEELKGAQERVGLEQQAKKIVSPLIVDEKLVQEQEELSAQKREELKKILVKKHTMAKFYTPNSEEAKKASQESKSFEPYVEKPVQRSWYGKLMDWFRR